MESMASTLLNQKEELSSTLIDVLQQTLVGLGVSDEKVLFVPFLSLTNNWLISQTLEIVHLARESQAKLSDGDREQLCYKAFQTLWNKHFQPFNQMEGVTKKVRYCDIYF